VGAGEGEGVVQRRIKRREQPGAEEGVLEAGGDKVRARVKRGRQDDTGKIF